MHISRGLEANLTLKKRDFDLFSSGRYFNQPRFLKYHIGTMALAAISASAYG